MTLPISVHSMKAHNLESLFWASHHCVNMERGVNHGVFLEVDDSGMEEESARSVQRTIPFP